MKFNSTNGLIDPTDFRSAVIHGLAPDGGLYFPEQIPTLENEWINHLAEKSLHDIAMQILTPFVKDVLSEKELERIVFDTFYFKIPLVNVHGNIFTLELFHGPTLAFKDVGARFMSRCLKQFRDEKDVVVLVATSGDTGSAVANGFLGVDGVEVVVLYPAGKVSPLQEKQFATLGKNTTAIAIDGTFDNCQAIVKKAFADSELNQEMQLSSANSINIARWLPQSIYFGWLAAQAKKLNPEARIHVSVPSGNFGNLTAGLLAQKMGIPIDLFVAATNVNDVVPEYLITGEYKTRKSVETVANAMDVGAPSNFVRLLSIFENDHGKIRNEIKGARFTDDEIREAIKMVDQKHNYLLDPHGAVGYLSIAEQAASQPDDLFVFLETAHPAKFGSVVQHSTGKAPQIPDRLQVFAERKVISIPMDNNYQHFKDFLLKSY